SVPSHAAVFVAIVVAVRRARRLTGPTDTHGSARWATRADLHAAGLVGRSGVYVGAWPDERETVYLRHDGPQHVLAFAPSRSGRGAETTGISPRTICWWAQSSTSSTPSDRRICTAASRCYPTRRARSRAPSRSC